MHARQRSLLGVVINCVFRARPVVGRKVARSRYSCGLRMWWQLSTQPDRERTQTGLVRVCVVRASKNDERRVR